MNESLDHRRNLTRLEAADFINRSHRALPRYYGDALVDAARRNPAIVCLTADLTAPTETDIFRDTFPDRFYQVGIAEANMIGLAGGMARTGEIPFVHSFCSFATKRCFDQITMQVAYPNLPVKIVGFMPGIATLLGVSHQAIEDVAIMRTVPNMMVLEPSEPKYFAAAVEVALGYEGPVYLRLKRPDAPPPADSKACSFEAGRGIWRRKGKDLAIIAAGMAVAEALAAAERLAGDGIEASVVDMASIKPLDREAVLECAETTQAILTVENHSIIGGLGSAVAETLCDAGIGLPFRRIGLEDRFAEGGSTAYLFKKYGLDAPAIEAAARSILRRKEEKGR